MDGQYWVDITRWSCWRLKVTEGHQRSNSENIVNMISQEATHVWIWHVAYKFILTIYSLILGRGQISFEVTMHKIKGRSFLTMLKSWYQSDGFIPMDLKSAVLIL